MYEGLKSKESYTYVENESESWLHTTVRMSNGLKDKAIAEGD